MDNSIDERGRITQKVGVCGIIGNIFLFCIKIVIGLLSGSQAMIADSINSGTDILSSLMTFIGGKISGSPSDEDHNYGHGKAEYIFTMLISVITISLAMKITIDALHALIDKRTFIFSWWLVLVCIITIVVKLSLYIYTKKIGKKNYNLLILANSEDHINDVLITSSVLIGVFASLVKVYWLDILIAIGIAVRISYIGVSFFLESYNVLLDKSISEKEKKEIEDMILFDSKINHIDKITSKSVGNKFIIIIKLSVDGNMTVNESHSIATKIKYEVLKRENVYDVVVHVNPC
jgi:cation diffusion facilitator family transporter